MYITATAILVGRYVMVVYSLSTGIAITDDNHDIVVILVIHTNNFTAGTDVTDVCVAEARRSGLIL